MRKLLLILYFIPILLFGQNIPIGVFDVNNRKTLSFSELDSISNEMKEYSESKKTSLPMSDTIAINEVEKEINIPIDSFKLNLNYVNSLSNKIDFYTASKNFDKVADVLKEKLEILKQIGYYDSIIYFTSEIQMGACYALSGKYNDALRYCKDIKSRLKQKTVNDSALYCMNLNCLRNYYFQLHDYKNALPCAIELASIYKKIGNKEAECFYYLIQEDIAKIYSNIAQYKNALSIQQEISNYWKENGDTIQFAIALQGIGSIYYDSGQIDESIPYLIQFTEIFRNYEDYDFDMNEGQEERWLQYMRLYRNAYQCIASYYKNVGDYDTALTSELENMRVCKKQCGEKSKDYIMSLFSLSSTYYGLHEKEMALEKLIESKEILLMMKGDNEIEYIKLLYVIGTIAYEFLEIDFATLCLEESILALKSYPNELEIFKLDLEYLAKCYIEKKKYEESIKISKTLLSLISNKESEEYASSLNLLSVCYAYSGNLPKAIEFGEKSLKVYCSINDILAMSYNSSVYNLFLNYYENKDTLNALLTLDKYNYFEKIKEEIVQTTKMFSFQGRKTIWERKAGMFLALLPSLANKTNNNSIISKTYDYCALFAKEYQLKTEIDISQSMYEDSVLQREYEEYMQNISLLSRHRFDMNNPISNTDSLLSIVSQQQKDIRGKIKIQGIDNSITWKSIQDLLEDDEIAIEFVSYEDPFENSKSKLIALTLKKDYLCPKMTPLHTIEKVTHVFSTVRDSLLYNGIWKPLEGETNGVRNIYFSPSGSLSNIGIEYLKDNNGQLLSDKYNMFRLSSTGHIAGYKEKSGYNHIVLFGGLDYDTNIVSLNEKIIRFKSSIPRSMIDSISSRNGFEPLYNTRKEVLDIAKIAKEHNIRYDLYEGIEGTEDSFKKLSGNHGNIIHLSTHGMYINSESALIEKTNKNLRFIEDVDYGDHILPEDLALSRSFLVMSGGNMLIQKKEIQSGNEDGILTAQEIAQIDLRGTDLVVLSACQTGLGDTSSQGTFGLQRGFKKAGANTILMSLNKVDDEATRILMVEFYRNLMSGKTKHQSLRDAQKYLRKVENGKYDKPEYWASFIMLDGLN